MSRLSIKDATPLDHLKPKVFNQYCIDTSYFLETIKTIPKSIRIITMQLRFMDQFYKGRKIPVTTTLRKLNVSQCYRFSEKLEVVARMVGLSRPAMIRNVRAICDEINLSIDRVIVRYVRLEYKGVEATFTRVAKEIFPDETDKRRKLMVLGLTSSQGNVASMIRELSASKYSCTVQRVVTNQIVCSSKNGK